MKFRHFSICGELDFKIRIDKRNVADRKAFNISLYMIDLYNIWGDDDGCCCCCVSCQRQMERAIPPKFQWLLILRIELMKCCWHIKMANRARVLKCGGEMLCRTADAESRWLNDCFGVMAWSQLWSRLSSVIHYMHILHNTHDVCCALAVQWHPHVPTCI